MQRSLRFDSEALVAGSLIRGPAYKASNDESSGADLDYSISFNNFTANSKRLKKGGSKIKREKDKIKVDKKQKDKAKDSDKLKKSKKRKSGKVQEFRNQNQLSNLYLNRASL